MLIFLTSSFLPLPILPPWASLAPSPSSSSSSSVLYTSNITYSYSSSPSLARSCPRLPVLSTPPSTFLPSSPSILREIVFGSTTSRDVQAHAICPPSEPCLMSLLIPHYTPLYCTRRMLVLDDSKSTSSLLSLLTLANVLCLSFYRPLPLPLNPSSFHFSPASALHSAPPAVINLYLHH
jgi:hypothetical protein